MKRLSKSLVWSHERLISFACPVYYGLYQEMRRIARIVRLVRWEQELMLIVRDKLNDR